MLQSSHRTPRSAWGAVLLVGILTVLLGCGLQTSGQIQPTPTATTAAGCAQALPGAGPASAGASFPDLPLPANSMSTAPIKTGGGGDGQFTLSALHLCTSQTSAAAVTAFFAGLTSQGWLHSNTFPADGSFQSPCAAANCWAKDVRYVRLDQPIADLGNGVEQYQLTLATAPPAPNCSIPSNIFLPGYYYKLPDPGYAATNLYADIPLPPLSRIVPDDALGGQRGYEMCSAGTAASITAFMNTQLTSLGWTTAGNGMWTQRGFSLTILLTAPTGWVIWWHDPDYHP